MHSGSGIRILYSCLEKWIGRHSYTHQQGFTERTVFSDKDIFEVARHTTAEGGTLSVVMVLARRSSRAKDCVIYLLAS